MVPNEIPAVYAAHFQATVWKVQQSFYRKQDMQNKHQYQLKAILLTTETNYSIMLQHNHQITLWI